MERKHKTLASVFLAAFLLVSIFAGSVHAELVGIDSAKKTGDYIYFLVLDSFGACNINPDTGEKYSDSEYDEITADSAADRCAGYGLRGGNLIFYIILPIVMAYIMLYAVMEQTRIFDKKTAKNMSIILSLLMVPLGVFRLIFIGLMSLLTGTTVTLLYIFLFVLMIGWGYRNMYGKGRRDINRANIHIDLTKRAADHVRNIDDKIRELNDKLIDIHKELEDIGMKRVAHFEETEPGQANKRMEKIVLQEENFKKEEKRIEEALVEAHKIKDGTIKLQNQHLHEV